MGERGCKVSEEKEKYEAGERRHLDDEITGRFTRREWIDIAVAVYSSARRWCDDAERGVHLLRLADELYEILGVDADELNLPSGRDGEDSAPA
jgi:hypothetical protein